MIYLLLVMVIVMLFALIIWNVVSEARRRSDRSSEELRRKELDEKLDKLADISRLNLTMIVAIRIDILNETLQEFLEDEDYENAANVRNEMQELVGIINNYCPGLIKIVKKNF